MNETDKQPLSFEREFDIELLPVLTGHRLLPEAQA